MSEKKTIKRDVCYIGIDPGLKGGITVLDENGDIILTKEMPVLKDVKKEYQLDIESVMRFINSFVIMYAPVCVYIEQQQAMIKINPFTKKPETQGVVSTFKTGMNYGKLIGLLIALGFDFSIVSSVKWKNAVIGKDREKGSTKINKEAARRKAMELFPNESFLKTERCSVPHDGMFESALIAHYAYITEGYDYVTT